MNVYYRVVSLILFCYVSSLNADISLNTMLSNKCNSLTITVRDRAQQIYADEIKKDCSFFVTVLRNANNNS
jgi:hypothetical protein